MADQRIEFELAVTGQARATREISRFGASVGTLNKRAEQSAGGLAAVAGGVGNLGTAVAGASPLLGTFAGMIGNAGSALGGLAGTLGGIGGLAAAGVIGALGVYIAKTQDATKATERFEAEVNKVLAGMEKIERQARLAAGATLELGGATTADLRRREAELQVEIREREKRIAELQDQSIVAQLTRSATSLGDAESIERQRQQDLRDARAELAAFRKERRQNQIELEKAARFEKLRAAPQSSGRDGPLGTPGTGTPGTPGTGTPLVTGGAAERAREREVGKAADKLAREATLELREFQISLRNAFRSTVRDVFDRDESIFGPTPTREQQIAEARKNLTGRRRSFRVGQQDKGEDLIRAENVEDAEKRIQQAQAETTQFAISNAQAVLTATILGAEGGAKAALKATGDALVGQGVKHSFEALAMAVIPGAQGNAGALAGIAAAEIIAGKAMGAAFSAPAGASAGAQGIRPQAIQQQAPTTQTVVNFFGIADRRTGEQVIEAMRVVKRQRGPKAVQI